jgi:ABC-2 type transport system ATP-binding protein
VIEFVSGEIVLIEIDALTKFYGPIPAVRDLSFAIRPGEVLGLVGPNGAGKTTTLRCIAGIIPPSKGDVRVLGHSIQRDPLAARQVIAFMPDEPCLFEYLTVMEHLQFTARVYGVAAFDSAAEALLQELELSDKRNALPSELSRGMKQKLVIACGLLHSPRALIFDEPLTGLDPIGIRRMKAMIIGRAREGASVVVSSHLLHLVEEICDRVLILKEGRKIIDAPLPELSSRLPNLRQDANLEEIFLQVTGHPEDPLQ